MHGNKDYGLAIVYIKCTYNWQQVQEQQPNMGSQLKMVTEPATKLIQCHSWSLVESPLRVLFQLSAFHSAIVQLSFCFSFLWTFLMASLRVFNLTLNSGSQLVFIYWALTELGDHHVQFLSKSCILVSWSVALSSDRCRCIFNRRT